MKSGNTRPSPAIPDHEVLRKIGGGAYGEVWLARGVTGALRAVKVVWREDFEDERTFEREFDGILKFEPISRDHPGLVNILHVGRSTGEESFYYYVMELGDDVATGREINPVEYEPLTLRCDHHEGPAERWPVEDCIEIGLRLAQALQHLHDKGLAHRDVKPSNVIFVNGKAKLADIGLVAARGQRTFVGTEGFVPPEGPGSAKADVYSLGKVLYEIATGMDRMNFPELPDDMPMGRNRRRWLELNRIICEVCEPRITKRKISSGGELAAALTRIQRGKRRRPGFKSLALTVLFLLSVSLWGSWHVVKDTEWFQAWLNPISEVEEIEGLYRIFSTPEGADVINSDGEIIGTTPTQVMKGIVGEGFHYVLRKEGFRPYHLDGIISLEAKDEPMVLHGELQIFSPPVIGEPWTNHLDHVYQPDGNAHLSATYVDRELWEQAQQTLKIHKRHFDYIKATENGVEEEIVLTTENFARQFAGWMQEQTLEAGFLTEDHEIRSVWDKTFTHPGMSDKAQKAKLRPFRLRAKRIIYASIGVTSSPPGAELSINGEPKGLTHGEMVVTGIKPGRIELKLELEGYKPLTKSYELEDGEPFQVHLELKKNQSVEFGKPWTNGIGMKFVPVGKDLMVSVWETRQRDYQKFLNEEVHQDPKPALFEQTDDHPVVNVSRKDAELFCEWLTRRERSKERITQSHEYRLPTDLEWSRFVGLLNEDPEASPGTRDSRKKEIFPWGPSLEEANIPGNFADMEAAVHPDTDVDRTIRGYDDGFAFTAPVGSFEPNELGLHDLSGNIQEWVSDAYSVHAQNSLGVLRGGGWNTYQLENLYSGARNAAPVDYAGPMYGFRVVIARKPLELADPETESP